MSEWKEYKITDIADIHDEKRIPLSKMQREKRQGVFPYYGASGIIDTIDSYIFDGEYVLISEDGENLKSRQTPIAFIAKGKFWVNNHAHIIKGRKPYHNKLIMYYLQNADLNPYITGAVQPKLNQENLLNIPFILPASVDEQRAIASVLSSLDDKIDLLHRQNKTLEGMAEALFRKWFVEGNGQSCLLSDLIDFNPLRSISKGTSAPYLEMSNVNTSYFHPDNWYNRDFSSGMKFINGDTLLARITPCLENGKACYITFLEKDQTGWGSTEYIVMRPKNNIHTFFAYALAKNRDFRDYAESCLEGSSGRQRVNVDHLGNYELTLPDDNGIDFFNTCMVSIEPKLISNFGQIRKLEQIRDSLLPKIMSGDVRVEA